MKRRAGALAFGGLALLTYFQFPGHTWLQQDSQIYVPILEHQYDPPLLRNDIIVQHPHVAFTLYDEMSLLLRLVTRQSLHVVLAFQQIATRALGIWGLYLMATALGLTELPAFLVAAICSLGTTINGPAVLTFEYEPTPRAFAVPLLMLSIGLTAHCRYTPAAVAATGAIFYHPPSTWPVLAVLAPLAFVRKQWQVLAILLGAILVLAMFGNRQSGQDLFGSLPPLQQQLQRMRTAYNWLSLWPRTLLVHWALVAMILVAAFWRLREFVPRELAAFALGLPALGILSMPVSWVLLDHLKWAIVPQIQPMRSLLFVALMMQLLTACAAVYAAARRNWPEAFGWFAAAYLLPLHADLTAPWPLRRIAVLLALAALTAALSYSAPMLAPAAAIMAFFAIPTLAGVVNYPVLRTPALEQLSAWARASTPRDAVFLFPYAGRQMEPGWFRSEALRAVYVDWKGGGQVNYMTDFAPDWWFRWRQTMRGFEVSDLPRYEALGIGYVVLPVLERIPPKPVYENAEYAVYDLNVR